jgi:hypothetical protein
MFLPYQSLCDQKMIEALEDGEQALVAAQAIWG